MSLKPWSAWHLALCMLSNCMLSPALGTNKVVNLYTYPAYFPQQVLQQFENETGIHVNVATVHGDNNNVFSKIKSMPTPTYDLAVVSNYSLDRFEQNGLLENLDPKRLANTKHLIPKLMQKINAGEAWRALPFFWGSTGMLVNTRYHDISKLQGWKDLWHSNYRDQLLLIDSMRDVLGMALLTLGNSPNTTNNNELKMALKQLMRLKANIKLFASDAMINFYVDEDVTLGMAWSTDAYLAQRDNPALRYVYPKEGFTIWVDTLVMVHDAPHKTAAYQLLNFLCRPEIAKQIFERQGVDVANQSMMRLLNKRERSNPILFPDAQTMKRGHLYHGLRESQQRYMDAWHHFKWAVALR